jgi:hypothetical protein
MGDDARPIDAVGTIYFKYNPLSPVNWNMAGFSTNVSVYADVAHALVAFKRALGERRPRAFSSLFFRGQSSVSARLLPTRLRGDGPRAVLGPKYAHTIAAGTGPEVVKQIHHIQGTWYRQETAMRSMDALLPHLPAEMVRGRDELERECVRHARARFSEIESLDEFRRRAAVRHYGGVVSSLVDVTEDPEIAAFFASGSTPDPDEQRYGMLWAVDIGELARLFAYEVVKVEGGEKIILTDQRQLWGDNKMFFEEQNLPPIRIEIVNVDLPLPRPTAQRGRFLSIEGGDGQPLPIAAELIWWSLIERWSYAVAFIQTGERYENVQTDITEERLFPKDDPYLALKMG